MQTFYFFLTIRHLAYILSIVHFVNCSEVRITDSLKEEVLSSWLNLSANLWNKRIVQELSYNESFVCNLLARKKRFYPDDPCMTAKELCAVTKLLKSQMNKILVDLEEKGIIERTRSDSDRRLVFVRLTDIGQEFYDRMHLRILNVVSQVIDRLGSDRAKSLAEMMNETAQVMNSIEKE